MYTVEDDLFQRARSVISALARELSGQQESGVRRPVDLRDLVRHAAAMELPEGGEADYLHAIADRLEKSFPIAELFPRRRGSGSS
jgi:hypothetical protein